MPPYYASIIYKMSAFKVRSVFEMTLPAELQAIGIDTDNVVLPLDEDPMTGYYRNAWLLTREKVLENLELIMKWVDTDSNKIPIEVSFTASNSDVVLSGSYDEIQLTAKNAALKDTVSWFNDQTTQHVSVYDVRKALMLPAFTDIFTTYEFAIWFRKDRWESILHVERYMKSEQYKIDQNLGYVQPPQFGQRVFVPQQVGYAPTFVPVPQIQCVVGNEGPVRVASPPILSVAPVLSVGAIPEL